MTSRPRAIRYIADLVGAVFSRLVAVVVGSVLMIVGLAMTATIVMLPMGILLGLTGLLILIGGLFAPVDPSARPQR